MRNAYPATVLDTNVPGSSADAVAKASLTGLNGTGLGSGSYNADKGLTLLPLPDISSGIVPLPTNAGATTVPNPFNRGYFNSYNMTVQQEMSKNVTFDVGYVGTYAVRPVVNLNPNASLPGTGTAGGILSQRYGANYTGGISELTPFLNARYDSLQSSVVWRFSGGSNLRMSYTWSKTLDYSENEDLSGLAFNYPTYWYKNYGFASFDRTNNVEIVGVIASPFGKGQPWVQNGVGAAILGGWLINPIVSMMSGIPFTVSAGGTVNAFGSNPGQTADLVSTFHISKGRPPRTGVTCALGDPSCSYFSASSFAAPYIPIDQV